MPFRRIDATIFVECAPTVEFTDGLFFVTYRAGQNIMRYCMLPSVYFGALKEAVDISRQHDRARKVVSLTDHAASASPGK